MSLRKVVQEIQVQVGYQTKLELSAYWGLLK